MINIGRPVSFVCMLVLVSLVSCDPGRLYEDNKRIDNDNWYYKNTIPFDLQIEDTSKWYNVYVNLRVSTDYKYSNIFMWLNVINPDKKSDRRRVEIRLADERGKWLGKGLGDIYDYQFPALQKIKFQQKGFYRFELEQNMRDDTLTHVKSVGIRVAEFGEQ
jgi:gliding motility-associated lipoprotein GldH